VPADEVPAVPQLSERRRDRRAADAEGGRELTFSGQADVERQAAVQDQHADRLGELPVRGVGPRVVTPAPQVADEGGAGDAAGRHRGPLSRKWPWITRPLGGTVQSMNRIQGTPTVSPALGGALSRGIDRRAQIHRSLLARGTAVVGGAGGPVEIRPARPSDVGALADLAQLDSARVPAQPLLVAEHGGRVVAAIGVRDRRVIADPWLPTATAVELLQAAAAEARAPARRRRWSARLPWGAGARSRRGATGAAD
jgi:hypothetical protein